MIGAYPKLPMCDLDHMFHGVGIENWSSLNGKRIFITGGTGFIGKWLLSALLEAKARLGIDCKVEVLTREPKRFLIQMPHLATLPDVTLRKGDVRNFEFPSGKFHIVIHAATDVIASNTPIETFSTCVDGTKRILDFTRACEAEEFLLTSSGAVYGHHPNNLSGISEKYLGGPDTTKLDSAYGEGKRVSEWLACAQAESTNIRVKIARIYAQVGPYLPLDKHFAIGNFIYDAILDRDIVIKGDGTPIRSYIYAADTAIWLWAMVFRGKSGNAWNVGGSEGMSIAELALRIKEILHSSAGICINMKPNPAANPERYVPNISKAISELSLPPVIEFENAVTRTAQWLRENNLITPWKKQKN